MNSGWVSVRRHPLYHSQFWLGNEQDGLQPASRIHGRLVADERSLILPFSVLRGYVIRMGFITENETHRHLNPDNRSSATPKEDYEGLTEEQLDYEDWTKKKNS